MDEDIFRRPGYLINRLARLSNRWADTRFQKLGLAIAQMPVLYTLKDGTSSTQSELARLAYIEQPTMAQLLARMERDGLIRRTANPDDRRSSLVSLTPRALKKLPEAGGILLDGHKKVLQGFTKQEIETLSHLLQRVLDNLEPMVAQDEADRTQ